MPAGVELRNVAAGRAHAEQERLPPFLKTRMFDINHDGALLDLTQTCRPEQLAEVPPVGTGQLRLVFDIRIELARRCPEEAERTTSASVVPYASCYDAARLGHTRHLAQPHDGISHEVNDKLRQRSIEQPILKG